MKKEILLKIFFYLLVILCPLFNYAQEKDTVLIRVNKIPNDTDKIIALCKVSSRLGMQDISNENIFIYQNIATRLSEKINSPKFYVRVNILRAAVLKNRGAYDSATVLLNRLIKISYKNSLNTYLATAYLDLSNIKSRNLKYREALCFLDSCLKYNQRAMSGFGIYQSYYSKARIYSSFFKPDSAIYNLQFALKNAIQRKDTSDISDCYSMMGTIYLDDGQDEKSLANSKKALKYAKSINDTYGLGILYCNIATVYERWKVTDSIIFFSKLSLEMCLKSGDVLGEGLALNGLGVGYLNQKKFTEALNLFSKSEKIFKEYADTNSIALNFLNTSKVYMAQKNYAFAEENFKKALHIATLKSILSIKLEAIRGLTDLFQKTGNYKQAYNYQKQLSILTDSILSKGRIATISELDAKYNNTRLEYEQAVTEKEKLILQNEKLEATKQLNFIIFISVVLVMAISFGFYLYNYNHKKTEERKRINAVLQSEEAERSRIARELHDGLGQLLSTARINAAALEGSVDKDDEKILDTTLKLVDQSINEVRTISHNLMPQVLADKGLNNALVELVERVNLGKGVFMKLNINGFIQLESAVEVAVYRVIQEIVNNMLKHSDASEIIINLNSISNSCKITVSDNGKGFDTTLIQKSEGIGWKNIETRLALINTKFEVESIINRGTKVSFEI